MLRQKPRELKTPLRRGAKRRVGCIRLLAGRMTEEPTVIINLVRATRPPPPASYLAFVRYPQMPIPSPKNPNRNLNHFTPHKRTGKLAPPIV